MKQELQISLAGIFGLLIIMAIATCTFPQKTTPKCKRIGCNREADESSEYCYYHDSRSKATVEDESDSISEKVDEDREDDTYASSETITGSESSHGVSTDSPASAANSVHKKSSRSKSVDDLHSKSKSSKSKSSRKASKKKAGGSKRDDSDDSCGNGYDDGYDDIEMNQDYDEERYDNDGGYAEGVDDAMEEAYYEYGEEW